MNYNRLERRDYHQGNALVDLMGKIGNLVFEMEQDVRVMTGQMEEVVAQMYPEKI